jgi:hypothetical protein
MLKVLFRKHIRAIVWLLVKLNFELVCAVILQFSEQHCAAFLSPVILGKVAILTFSR